MLITTDKLKTLITIPEGVSDEALKLRLDALEASIRGYTNNHFIKRGWTVECQIAAGGVVTCAQPIFAAGDTVEINHSEYNDGLYTVVSGSEDGVYVLDGATIADKGYISLVKYPADLIAGAARLLDYDLNGAGSAGSEGVASETISRHSVTYRDASADAGSILGYPSHLSGFLRAYRRAQI